MASGYEKAASGVDPNRGWDTGKTRNLVQRGIDTVLWLLTMALFAVALYKGISILLG